ncbi:MAG: alpha/beta hydrolase [Alphaproteobacteria bacterium]|nr:alpha/beta hydrolase [Alphaproteobacteria bacterium]
MAARPAYLDLNQEALDREYNNRAQRPGPEFDAFMARCAADSAEARHILPCALDIPYGPSAEETLDVFTPAGAKGAPVNIFFHGGYWRAFNKSEFSYVALGPAQRGIVTVVVNYALIPAATMATLIDQCRRAVLWAARHIGAYGGDLDRLYLSGHSAGGHIVAMLLAQDAAVELPRAAIAGACAISGVYELEPVRRCFLNKTLGFTDEDIAHFSPRTLAPTLRCPLLVAVGARESAEFLRQSRDFAATWKASYGRIETAIISDKDHFSIRTDLSDPNAPMTALMLDHLNRALQSAPAT